MHNLLLITLAINNSSGLLTLIYGCLATEMASRCVFQSATDGWMEFSIRSSSSRSKFPSRLSVNIQYIKNISSWQFTQSSWTGVKLISLSGPADELRRMRMSHLSLFFPGGVTSSLPSLHLSVSPLQPCFYYLPLFPYLLPWELVQRQDINTSLQ